MCHLAWPDVAGIVMASDTAIALPAKVIVPLASERVLWR
jgi:hypothetical protein